MPQVSTEIADPGEPGDEARESKRSSVGSPRQRSLGERSEEQGGKAKRCESAGRNQGGRWGPSQAHRFGAQSLYHLGLYTTRVL